MTILLVQTFLLLLGAFLLGTSLACIVRRGVAERTAAALPPTSPGLTAATTAGAAVSASDADRFGRALTGGHGAAAAFQPATGPVVEVQPRPPVRVAPLIQPVESEPAPEPVVAAPAPPPAPDPVPEPEPQSAEQSYTQVAVAVAAGAAAVAAARGAVAEQEETAAEEDLAGEHTAGEEPVEAAADDGGLSYTEIAVGATAGLAAAAAAGSEDEREPEGTFDEATDAFGVEAAAASHFGTPVAGDVVPDAVEGDDLTRIHTIDAGLRERLNRLGVTRFADIGGWSASDVIRFSQSLGVVPGRIEQENWVGQAQVLAGSGVTDYPRWRGPELMPRAAAPADGERLHRIIGIDPDSEGILRANGVATIADIAAWGEEDVSWFEGLLGAPGRIGRENWVEQARFLTRGSGVAGAIQTVAAPAAAGVAAAVAAAAASAGEEETSAPQPAEADAAEPEASEPGPAAEASEECAPPPAALAGARGDGYSGLRSVRSEALVGSGGGLVVPPAGEVDDLKRIRGIGVLIEKKLHSLGITSYEQVANWTGEDIERISQVLDFKGRIERENWIEQARILASGGQTEFSRRVDRGEA